MKDLIAMIVAGNTDGAKAVVKERLDTQLKDICTDAKKYMGAVMFTPKDK